MGIRKQFYGRGSTAYRAHGKKSCMAVVLTFIIPGANVITWPEAWQQMKAEAEKYGLMPPPETATKEEIARFGYEILWQNIANGHNPTIGALFANGTQNEDGSVTTTVCYESGSPGVTVVWQTVTPIAYWCTAWSYDWDGHEVPILFVTIEPMQSILYKSYMFTDRLPQIFASED